MVSNAERSGQLGLELERGGLGNATRSGKVGKFAAKVAELPPFDFDKSVIISLSVSATLLRNRSPSEMIACKKCIQCHSSGSVAAHESNGNCLTIYYTEVRIFSHPHSLRFNIWHVFYKMRISNMFKNTKFPTLHIGSYEPI